MCEIRVCSILLKPVHSLHKETRNCICNSNEEADSSQDSTSELNKVCLFCKRQQKMVNRNYQKLHDTLTTAMINAIRAHSKILGEMNVLSQTTSVVDALPSALYYHKYCMIYFHIRASKKTSKTRKLRAGFAILYQEETMVNLPSFDISTSTLPWFQSNSQD